MSSLHYRQNIVASIRIAGHRIVDVVSHGGNRADGSHLTACFGSQVMITMLDLTGRCSSRAPDSHRNTIGSTSTCRPSYPPSRWRRPSAPVRA